MLAMLLRENFGALSHLLMWIDDWLDHPSRHVLDLFLKFSQDHNT